MPQRCRRRPLFLYTMLSKTWKPRCSVKIKQPSPNTGLVGRHDYAVTGPVKPGYGSYTAGQRDPFIDSLDVIIGVLIDYTIPVENYQLSHLLGRYQQGNIRYIQKQRLQFL